MYQCFVVFKHAYKEKVLNTYIIITTVDRDFESYCILYIFSYQKPSLGFSVAKITQLQTKK